MRLVKAAIPVILIACSVSLAGDYIRIDVDSIPAGAVNFQIPFYVERTCPDPPTIIGMSLGFILSATGTVEYQYAGWQADPVADTWCFPHVVFNSGLPLTWDTDGQFLCGGAGMPPAGGMPVLEEEHKFWDLYLDVRGEGEILIDSGFVFVAGSWMFSGLTCGLGGAPNRPLFLAKDGSDLNHPIRITVYEPICGDANLDGGVDIDDLIYIGMYIFAFGPAPNPYHVGDANCSGQIDIDDVVYLLFYIFADGPAPCDTDGDGVADC
jgi:hypothetical protein